MEKKRGITLVALVITMVVLIILAGVTIAIAIGPNGLITKANDGKLASRYAIITDRVKLREADLEVAFKTGQNGDEGSVFINKLEGEGLVKTSTGEDKYTADERKLEVGKQKDGTYKYSIYIMDGTEAGRLAWERIQTLPDANEPGNEHLKNMTLIVETTAENQQVTIPISNASGLEINWDSEANPENFEAITTSDPKHTYSTIGEYKVQIKGTPIYNVIFGKDNEYYNNPNLVGIEYWGEIGLYRINSFGQNLEGEIPIPSRNSFKNVMFFYSTFKGCSKLTGTIPENLFANCPNAKYFNSTFQGCSGLTGTIPDGLFSNCLDIRNVEFIFCGCSKLTGTIPDGLFSNCSNITTFTYAFHSCKELTGIIPENLFLNCSSAEDFSYTFTQCKS